MKPSTKPSYRYSHKINCPRCKGTGEIDVVAMATGEILSTHRCVECWGRGIKDLNLCAVRKVA